MKKTLSISIICLYTSLGFAQTDTIVSNNEKIPCQVKEITTDAVKYSYSGEEVTASLYKNAVQKIIFKNGRIQTFSEATLFKTIEKATDYDNVTITQVESEIKGLFKLGDASAKAKGTTIISNQERVKERAYRKFKIQAAMQGGNCIFLTNQRTNGNFVGGPYQMSTSTEASLTGVVYTNQLPNYQEFIKLISDKHNFMAIQELSLFSCFADLTKCDIKKKFSIYSIKNEHGLIMIEGQIEGVPNYQKFRVVSFTKENYTIFYENKSTQYNIVVKI
jgi:hypothetical protein